MNAAVASSFLEQNCWSQPTSSSSCASSRLHFLQLLAFPFDRLMVGRLITQHFFFAMLSHLPSPLSHFLSLSSLTLPLILFIFFTLYSSLLSLSTSLSFLNSSSFVFLWDGSSHFLNFILGSLYHSVFATGSWHTSTLFHSRSFSPACTQSTLHLSHSLTHTLSFTLSLSFFMSLVHSSPHSLLDPPSTIHMWRA